MRTLEFNQMENLQGGVSIDTLAGGACGAMMSGIFFGGFGLAVSAAIFGPSCIGFSIGAILED